MRHKHNITEKFVDGLRKDQNALYFDKASKGFGVRIQNGVVTFFLNYRFMKTQRRITLGDPNLRRWQRDGKGFTVKKAKEAVLQARTQMSGEQKSDPKVKRDLDRTAPLVSELCDQYLTEHAIPHKRKNSVRDDRAMIRRVIIPTLGHMTVASVTRRDVQRIHNSYKARPYYANRIVALTSTMWNLAKEWNWAVTDNPARTSKKGINGIKPFHEDERKPWLTDQQVNGSTRSSPRLPIMATRM
jgi:hypothetical protein